MKPGWQPRVRSWKGCAFWCLKRLADAGMIEDRNGTKTAIVTEEGVAWSQEVLTGAGHRAAGHPDADVAAGTA